MEKHAAPEKLIFVYNAHSGLLNAGLDILHKIISPATYPCSLCAITYGTFKIKKTWEEFIAGLNVQTAFLHDDEFIKQFGPGPWILPSVYQLQDGKLSDFISKSEIDQMDLNGLIELVQQRIEKR